MIEGSPSPLASRSNDSLCVSSTDICRKLLSRVRRLFTFICKVRTYCCFGSASRRAWGTVAALVRFLCVLLLRFRHLISLHRSAERVIREARGLRSSKLGSTVWRSQMRQRYCRLKVRECCPTRYAVDRDRKASSYRQG